MSSRPTWITLTWCLLILGFCVSGSLAIWALSERSQAREVQRIAEEARTQAEDALSGTLATLQTTIDQFRQNEALFEPRFLQTRHRLAQSLEANGERLLHLDPTSSHLNQALAETLRSLAVFLEQTQGFPAAVPYYQRAREVFAREDNRLDQAICLHHLATGYENLGQPEKAMSALDASLRLLKEEQADRPDDLDLRYRLAFGINHRGHFGVHLNQFAQAEADLDEASRLWDGLCQESPNRLEYQLRRTVTQAIRADLRERQGKRAEAIQLLQGLIAQRRELTQSHASTMTPWLAEAHAHLTAVHVRDGRFDLAKPEALEMARLRRQLMEQHPGQAEHLNRAAIALTLLATIHTECKETAEATAAAEEASAIQKRLVEVDPENHEYAIQYAGSLINLAETHAREKPHLAIRDLDLAIPHLARAIFYAPHREDLWTKLRQIGKLRTTSYQALGSPPPAVDLGATPSLRVLSAIAQEGMGNSAGARKTLEGVTSENATLGDLYAVAVVRTRLGDFDEALAALRSWAVPYEARWELQWFPVRILDREGERIRVHYVGYPASDDETVVPARVRSRILDIVRLLETRPELKRLRESPSWPGFLDAVKDGRTG